GYARIASFLVNEAQNHPSVIFYSMSHNATGYAEDMNPFLMDGIAAPRSRWGVNNLARASRAEAIVQKLDPSRIIYHHASGNLGPMHISNFYANWVPIQEMSDWFEHWGTVGTKPMFTCEYGVPFTWDWAMYRGWYKGVREFGSAPVPWEFANAEWNAQFVGDVAFNIGEPEKRNLRWEAQKFREGAVWHRWDYPHVLGAREFTDQDPILAAYITDNWRAFRTWGLSINSYWEHSRLWSLRPGVDKSRKDYTTDWENLQRPGFSPDFQESRFERIDLAFERDDWIPSEGAEALIRNNMPLLGYIAGKEGDFTEKGHNFFAGELVEKQLVTVNNSRETVFDTFQFTTDFSLNGMGMAGSMNSSNDLKTGTLHQLPVIFSISDNAPPGAYDIEAEFGFFMVERYADANPDEDDMDIEIQTDTFTIHVMPPLPSLPSLSIALFDPHGETAKMLDEMGVRYETADGRRQIAADASGAEAPLLPSAVSGLPSDAVLIIGKNALSLHDDGIDLSAVPDGLRVIVFEQSAEVLEKRLGLRTAEYGLRNVFKRVPDHPLLENIGQENLRDWRGSATLLPVPMEYETNDNVFNGVPTAEWCGITVPRVWRSSNRGSVASVLIEKPTCGDFLPILDGGFSLQYSPLMEYRHGKRMILFCQMDVTGRTENDPAALHLVNNILRYVNGWKPRTGNLRVLYRGDDALGKFLNKLGAFYDNNYERQRWTNLLVIGPNFEQSNAGDMSEVRRRWGAVLAVGLNEDDLKQAFPDITFKEAEHISTYFEPFGMSSPLRGISPADVHNRDPRVFPLITDENIAVGNGILGVTDEGRTVIFGMAPWQFASAEFPDGGQSFKRTFRRSAFMLSRILGNMNVDLRTPLVERFHGTVGANEMRWLDGLYLDEPEEWDDPYRFFRW
ncbi:MAG: hypothetical protein FWE95_10210, partial [Planctomycetaceae bacterium]|nr:hypothetical protein [Planctomycetaceae bacterium]